MYIELPENNSFTENLFLKEVTLQRMISTRHSRHSSRRWQQQQQQHSPIFPAIGWQIQKSSLYKTDD